MTKVMNLVELSRYAEERADRVFLCTLNDGPCLTASVSFTSFDVCVNARVVSFQGKSGSLVIGSVRDARLTGRDSGVLRHLIIRTDYGEVREYEFITT